MYKTNITSSVNSSIQAKSFANIQKDLWDSDDQSHNPDSIVISQVLDHYHQTFKRRPRLEKLLIERKINPDYIDQFKIGFSDRTLGFELRSPKSLLGSRNRGHLQRLGLLKSTGHEFFRGAMVIPYSNEVGQIIGAYGRRPFHQPRSPAYHLYWNAQAVPLFNSANGLPESLILCKSALDTLTLLTAGVENAVATMGTQGFNDVQLSQIAGQGVRSVYIAFDNTPAADHRALLVAQALDAVDVACFRVRLPLGYDVNRFAMKQSDVASAFNRLVSSAVPLKQRYGKLIPKVKDQWLKQLISIEDCTAFYLEELKNADKTSRTLNAVRIHLDRFQDFCYSQGIDEVLSLSNKVLDAYRDYLASEKNVFTGKVVSYATQIDRMDTVERMLSRLHYYGIIREPLAFSKHLGTLH